ncbi:MCE family protein [Nocardioides sp. Bht2]|uniref:MCE family protein n=1 Tax=Nocardioides sp. Bht2 TaxID=3392297 RepID=UPI0039B455E6
MLLTATIKRQLVIFAVLSLVALGLTFFRYAQVPKMAGVGVYDVTVEYQDASGLYPKALVTQRGVKVGKVEEMTLGDGRTVVRLRLDDDAKIPADSVAMLRSTSAIGEQYVDLVSESRGGPYLKPGAVIGVEQTVEMPQISPVLDSVNALLESVPKQATRRVLSQVQDGLGGAESDVDGIVDAAQTLLAEAHQQVDATTGLVRALTPVLRTQTELDAVTRQEWADLARVTREVAGADKALNQLLDQGPDTLATARGVIDDVAVELPLLVTNLRTVSLVAGTYLPNLTQVLAVYPATVARLQSTVNPRAEFGDVKLDLRAGVNNPVSCTDGYLAVRDRRSPAVSSVRVTDELSHCEGAPSRPSSVRGARNLPCPNSSARGPLPTACGLEFPRAQRVDGESAPTTDQSKPTLPATELRGDDWTALLTGPLGVGR